MNEKLKGTVKWFNSAKGFGFIDHKGTDYFVHFKNIVMDGYKSLTEGDEVEFSPQKSERGFSATDVDPIT